MGVSLQGTPGGGGRVSLTFTPTCVRVLGADCHGLGSFNSRDLFSYPALKSMLMAVGGDRVERLASGVKYDFKISEKPVVVSGMNFSSIEVDLPKQELFYSSLDSFADSDKVMVEFFNLLKLLTDLASIRTIVWRLANEVRKTQRRVNALDKMVIPQTRETKVYIESVLEERERENVFVLKALKSKQKKGGLV